MKLKCAEGEIALLLPKLRVCMEEQAPALITELAVVGLAGMSSTVQEDRYFLKLHHSIVDMPREKGIFDGQYTHRYFFL